MDRLIVMVGIDSIKPVELFFVTKLTKEKL
jgi:hypothetical protein